jgi:hypothetical protein
MVKLQRQKTWKSLISYGLEMAENHYNSNIRYHKLKSSNPLYALKLKLSFAKWFAGNINTESFI